VRRRITEPGGLYFFNKVLCGFPDLSERTHLPLTMLVERLLRKELPQRSLLVEYPRKHMKTTVVTEGATLWMFCLHAALGEDLTTRAALASSTKTNAMRFLRLVKMIVETNPVLRSFFPEIVPDFGDEQVWNQDEILFARQRVFPEPSIDTIGAGTKTTSRHYSLIMEDDMINEENYDSPTAVGKAIELHQLYENLLESNNDVRIVTGNSWSGADLNEHIIRTEPDTIVFSVDAEDGINWDRSRHIPDDIARLCEEWKDGRGLWLERFPIEELAKIRQKVGPRIYNAQYKNKPFDPDVVDFKQEWLRYYEWGRRPDGEKVLKIQPPGQPLELVELRDLQIVAAWDPAMGRKTDSDRSAFVVTGVDPKSRVFVLDVLAVRMDPADFLDAIFDTLIEWKVRRVGIESVAFQRLIFRTVDLKLKNERLEAEMKGDKKARANFLSTGVFEELRPLKGKDKEGRIRHLLSGPFRDGLVYMHASQIDLISEYTTFPVGKTDDILDALAYTAMLWERGITEDDETTNLRLLDEMDKKRDPITGY
jgi:phage terminase large subunit-like protein